MVGAAFSRKWHCCSLRLPAANDSERVLRVAALARFGGVFALHQEYVGADSQGQEEQDGVHGGRVTSGLRQQVGGQHGRDDAGEVGGELVSNTLTSRISPPIRITSLSHNRLQPRTHAN